MSKRPLLTIAAGFTAALLASACLKGGVTTSSAPSGTSGDDTGQGAPAATVEIVNFAYAPTPVKIKKGQSIKFTNKDAALHSVTVTSGPDEDVKGGEEKVVKFDAAGTIKYICKYHPSMKATVEVEEE